MLSGASTSARRVRQGARLVSHRRIFATTLSFRRVQSARSEHPNHHHYRASKDVGLLRTAQVHCRTQDGSGRTSPRSNREVLANRFSALLIKIVGCPFRSVTYHLRLCCDLETYGCFSCQWWPGTSSPYPIIRSRCLTIFVLAPRWCRSGTYPSRECWPRRSAQRARLAGQV